MRALREAKAATFSPLSRVDLQLDTKLKQVLVESLLASGKELPKSREINFELAPGWFRMSLEGSGSTVVKCKDEDELASTVRTWALAIADKLSEDG